MLYVPRLHRRFAMRLATAALALFFSIGTSAQDRVSAVTVASGYATGFEAGAVHSEGRVRVPVTDRVSIEPLVSLTRGFAYGQRSTCVSEICALPQTRSEGASAIALGSALTYRITEALPLGLDSAHAGLFAQALVPIWESRGQRVGAEVGAEARVSRLLTVGADVQAAYFTATDAGLDRVSVAPLVRVSVGR